MTKAVRELLAGFDALSAADKQQAASEILRRTAGVGDIPDSGFDELAAELFRSYDAEEAGNADPSAR
jgi:hypothetical protein